MSVRKSGVRNNSYNIVEADGQYIPEGWMFYFPDSPNEVYQVVDGGYCSSCDLRPMCPGKWLKRRIPKCTDVARSDGKSVIFKKL